MEDVLLDNIKKAILDANFFRNITVPQIEGILSLVKEYGDYRHDAGIDWCLDQQHYSAYLDD